MSREPDTGELIEPKPRRGFVPPTWQRNFYDAQGHARSRDGLDNQGNPWQGMSRIHDRSGRRRKNKQSWARLLVAARRAAQPVKE